MAKLEDYFTAQSALNVLRNSRNFVDYDDNLVTTCNVPEYNTTVLYTFTKNPLLETVNVTFSYFMDNHGGINYVTTIRLDEQQLAQYNAITMEN